MDVFGASIRVVKRVLIVEICIINLGYAGIANTQNWLRA